MSVWREGGGENVNILNIFKAKVGKKIGNILPAFGQSYFAKLTYIQTSLQVQEK